MPSASKTALKANLLKKFSQNLGKNMDFKNYSVITRPKAKNDLANLFDFFLNATQEIEIAERIIDIIEKKLSSLSFMPNSHAKFSENTRRLVGKNFIAIFSVNEEKSQVAVLRVYHPKMNYLNYSNYY